MIDHLQQKVAKKETQVATLESKIDRLRHRASYWKSKCLKEASSSGQEDLDDAMESERSKLRDEVAELEQENLELRSTVQEIMSESKEDLVTFEKGKYTDDVRACCYELLSLNVGVRNVKAVIKSVLKNIVHKSAGRLPQKTVLCDMMIECLTLAQAQLGEELSSEEGTGYTIQTDGTTKFSQHFSTYDICTADSTYRLGLRHVFSGSAQNTLETLTEILEDIDVVQKECGRSAVSATIIAKIKNTMSDRHSAEKLFSEVLADYRASILPDIVLDWENLSTEEQSEMTRMNNFFCGLHFLVGLADAAEETLKIWESAVEEKEPEAKSSSTQRLIRTACKAFHHRGSEQAGCSTHFRAYLRREGEMKIPLAAFVGNRFNVIFYDAAGVYYLRKHMLAYLSGSHGSLNRLLQAVLTDLRTPHLLSGCRALGIIDKVVTGPFWRYLQSSSKSILQMSNVYTMMKDKFEQWSSNALCVMEDQACLFESVNTAEDKVAASLFATSDEEDVKVQELLQFLFKSFAVTIQRLLIDHLPGGKYHNVSDPKIIQETMSVPKTNINPERDFGILDRLMSQKPNSTYIALESLLLFSQNKTSDWLFSKSAEERDRLIKAARTLTSVHRANFTKRREEIERQRREAVERKERELQRKKEKELREKEVLTLKVQSIGLWTARSEVRQHLCEIKCKKDKISALKTQINFRKKVLNQSHSDKLVFQFSSNRRAFTVEELTENLMKLLPPLDDVQCTLSVADISADPELLIYRRIKHLFDCGGDQVWYKGTVLSYDASCKLFRVAYDNEEEVCSFSLLEDIISGDLIVL